MPNNGHLTPAEALFAFDARIAETRYKFGPEGYVCFGMREAVALHEAFTLAIRSPARPNNSLRINNE